MLIIVGFALFFFIGISAMLARALAAGGLPAIEVTLRTPAALDAIRAGQIDAAIAGGAEVPLSPLAFGAFDIIRAVASPPRGE